MKRALLLGECPNPKVYPLDTWDRVPAFSAETMLRHHSGWWLRRRLQSPVFEGWKFTLENAVTLERVESELCQFDAIVALSRRVSKIFQVPYVPHPAYWKRFHYSTPHEWIGLLDEALQASFRGRNH